MKKFMILLVVVALVLAFASTAFAGVPGHPFGRDFGDLASEIARGGPDSIFAAIRAHF